MSLLKQLEAEYRKLQLQLPKTRWNARGNSWITGWMCAELQMELASKQRTQNEEKYIICKT